ncbi:MAG: acyltransferase family protein [Peptostreptococcaceae bacterium]
MEKKILNESYYMNIVKVIGIIMVVAGHTGFNLFDMISLPYKDDSEIFTAYSYHMPLFIFISGYFFNLAKNNNLKSFINKKISTLIIPYYRTNLFYAIFTTILVAQGLFDKSEKASLYNIIVESWISGYQFNLNGPGWFVLFIFLVQVIYIFTRKKLIEKNDKYIDFMLLGIFIILGFISTYCSIDFNEFNYPFLWVLIRTSFGFQFYHMGYMYIKYLKYRLPLTKVSFIILIIIKLIFIEIIGNYSFSMRALVFRNSVFLPLIVSILGIYYVLHIAKFIVYISYLLKKSHIESIINYIGSNTWSIMMHHMTVNFMYIKIVGVGNNKGLDFFVRPLMCLVLPLIWSKTYEKIITLKKYKRQNKEITSKAS